MSKTIESTAPTIPEALPGTQPTKPAKKRTIWYWVWLVPKSLASLRLTVVLFVLGIILVFCGTLAQVDAGIWTTVDKYFRSVFVWIPFSIFFPPEVKLSIRGGFPFPGGWLIGSLLLVNLLAAHAMRFKLSWKRTGIIVIHAGMIIMLLGELITGLFAVESTMSIAEGETVGWTEVSRETELAFIDRFSDPENDNVVVIPGSILRKGGLIQNPQLPVDVQVVKYMKNSNLVEAKPELIRTPEAVEGKDGFWYTITEHGEESGVSANQREDAAAVKVIFKKKGSGEELGTYLLSVWYHPNYTRRQLRFEPQVLPVEDQKYEVALRFQRTYKPYHLHLIDFKHDKYPNTEIPRNYSSQVRLSDAEVSKDREVVIAMNEPLRYRGETFYQSGFFPKNDGTVLQVVRNPGWLMPYFSCALVSLGMVVHFGINLLNFLVRRVSL